MRFTNRTAVLVGLATVAAGDFGRLVGFYVDGKGNTDGFLAIP